MDQKLKVLIGVGASVTANCIPCIRHHFAKAREIGIGDDEIRIAVQVGKKVRKGAAIKWDEELDDLFSANSSSTCERQTVECPL